MPILLRQCKAKAGYEALPIDKVTGKWDQERRLDFKILSQQLRGKGYDVLDAGPLLVVKRADIIETTIYRTGRLMIKTDQEAKAKPTAEVLYRDMGLE